jgi:ABC-type dipeptide/oligopeptide/nickel transport system permease subunit
VAVRAFARHRAGLFGTAIVAGLALVALGAPWLALEPPDQQDLGRALTRPSLPHVLGTDELGRDIWSRVVYGARISLGAAVLIVGGAAIAGLGMGLASAHYRGVVDEGLMRLTDVLLAFPGILLAIAIVSVLGSGSLFNVAIALAIYIVPGFARLVRATSLAEGARDYVDAARALGASDLQLMLRHLLPNIVGTLLVQATLRMGTVILLFSGFSFLGLGPRPPTPEWGLMLATGNGYLRTDPHLALVPGAAIFLAVLGFNLVGDALRDLLDPYLRHLR